MDYAGKISLDTNEGNYKVNVINVLLQINMFKAQLLRFKKQKTKMHRISKDF